MFHDYTLMKLARARVHDLLLEARSHDLTKATRAKARQRRAAGAGGAGAVDRGRCPEAAGAAR